MVLPPPAPDDAHGPDRPAWLARLNGIFQLVHGGVLVLVDGATTARLGELVRSLLPSHPDLEVHADALRLTRVAPGTLVILVPDARQADWLNIERPILANRSLRVVLFSDTATSGELARRAPDFFHWISHRLECPPGPPLPAVRGIRAALRSRAEGVAWMGGDLNEAFRVALPGRSLTKVSAALPYDEMVEAAKPAGRAWVAWTDVDGPFRLRRVRWASAEAGRRGKVVLVEPKVEAPGFARVDGRLLGVREACARLEAAGAKHAGRVAALLELEPGAVEVAERLLRNGVAEQEVENMVEGVGDAGAAIARVAESHRVLVDDPLRARAHGVARRPRDPQEVLPRPGERWVDAAEGAIQVGDIGVAVLWAKRGFSLSQNDSKAMRVLGGALARSGDVFDAEVLLKRSLTLVNSEKKNDENRIITLAEMARCQRLRSNFLDAERSLRQALAAAKRLYGEADENYATILHELGTVLSDRGRYDEAEKMLKESASMLRKRIGKSNQHYATAIADLAGTLKAKGRYAAAESMTRESLRLFESISATETPQYASAVHGLGSILLERGNYAESEKALRESINLKEIFYGKNSASYAASLHELARCLVGQGQIDDAEHIILQALSIFETSAGADSTTYAASLHELAGISMQRGNYVKAERIFRQALHIEERACGSEHPSLCSTLGDLAVALFMQGHTAEGEVFMRRALNIAETRLGPQAPDTAKILYILAVFEARRGSPHALDTARRALGALKRTFGPSYPTSRAAAELVEQLASS